VTIKPIIPRARANRDVDEAIAGYLGENTPQAALGLANALEYAYSHIARPPAAGSARYALALNLPGLRSWQLKNYPYLAFYVERDNHIDVWRVLHSERDIPAWLLDKSTGIVGG